MAYFFYQFNKNLEDLRLQGTPIWFIILLTLLSKKLNFFLQTITLLKTTNKVQEKVQRFELLV